MAEIQQIHVPLNPDLVGHPIRAAEACKKYDIADSTLTRWAAAGLITIIERGPKLLVLDEADVQRVVKTYRIALKHTNTRQAGWVLKRSIQSA